MSALRAQLIPGTCRSTLSAMLLLACASVSMAGQQPGVAPDHDQSQGPLVLQPISSHVVLAPDFKVTKVNGTTGQLVGGYAGKIVDNTLFLGGGGYWLVNPSDNLKLAYGGFVLGWQIGADRFASLAVKGLFGVGQARVPEIVFFLPLPTPAMGGLDRDVRLPDLVPARTRVTFRDSFLIAEPEVDLSLRLADRIRLNVGAGYRAVGQAGGLEDRLRGATGTLALQFTVGK